MSLLPILELIIMPLTSPPCADLLYMLVFTGKRRPKQAPEVADVVIKGRGGVVAAAWALGHSTVYITEGLRVDTAAGGGDEGFGMPATAHVPVPAPALRDIDDIPTPTPEL